MLYWRKWDRDTQIYQKRKQWCVISAAAIQSLPSDVWMKWDLEKWNLVSPKSTRYPKRLSRSLTFTELAASTASVNTCNIWHGWSLCPDVSILFFPSIFFSEWGLGRPRDTERAGVSVSGRDFSHAEWRDSRTRPGRVVFWLCGRRD